MNIKIQSKSGIPIYTQIAQQLKEEIIAGNLEAGEPLPSIRGLASDLKISVITTKRAYEELEQEGLVYSVPGKGFYVDDPDLAYLEEKKTLGVQEIVTDALKQCKAAGLSKEEVMDMVSILWEE